MISPDNLTTGRMTDLLTVLTPAVLEAGEVIMEIHRRGVVARTKSDGSPVSEADEAAEAILLAALAEHVPDIAVVSEENAASHAIDPPRMFFLVDPIDGTREFLRADGNGAFTVNIGLVLDRRPVFGIVHAPALDRFFAGMVGGGAWETSGGETRAIRVRDIPETGPLAVASRSHRDPQTNGWLDEHGITDTIATGSSVKFGLLAAGEVDVYPRFGPTMEWDTAAGEAVLLAAGGRVAFLDGSDFTYGKPAFRNTPFIAYAGYNGQQA